MPKMKRESTSMEAVILRPKFKVITTIHILRPIRELDKAVRLALSVVQINVD